MKNLSKKKIPKRKQNKKGLSLIKGIKDLKNLLAEGYYEYLITLKGGLISRKNIEFNPKTKKFYIINWVDDSEQKLTQKQLMQKSYTNIGYALRKKALLVNLKEKYNY